MIQRVIGMSLFLLAFVLHVVPVQAANYYYSDNESYWIYEENSPGFQVLVPANRVDYYEKTRFGENRTEISISTNGPVLTIASVKGYGGTAEKIRKSVAETWSYLMSDVKTVENREITTSKGLRAKFYVYQGKGQHGKDIMIRLVIFQRGSDVAYLSYVLDADEYSGDVRQFWLEAVNSFQWK